MSLYTHKWTDVLMERIRKNVNSRLMHDFKASFNNKLFSNRLKKTDNYVQQNWMMKSKQVERGIHKEQRGRNNTTHGQTDLTDAYLSCKR